MVISPDENGDFTGNPTSVGNLEFRMNINFDFKTRLPGGPDLLSGGYGDRQRAFGKNNSIAGCLVW